MKSYKVIERKYNFIEDKELSKKINLTFIDLFNNYEKLDEESIINLRVIIRSIFYNLRKEEYYNGEFRNELEELLYPNISFVGLSKLYSSNKHLQMVFLEQIQDELKYELNKNNDTEKTKKIK